MTKKQDKFEFPFSIYGALILIGLDSVASAVPVLGGIAIGMIGFFVLMITEYFDTKDIFHAFIKAFVGAILIAIPTPIAGIIAGAGSLIATYGGKR